MAASKPRTGSGNRGLMLLVWSVPVVLAVGGGDYSLRPEKNCCLRIGMPIWNVQEVTEGRPFEIALGQIAWKDNA